MNIFEGPKWARAEGPRYIPRIESAEPPILRLAADLQVQSTQVGGLHLIEQVRDGLERGGRLASLRRDQKGGQSRDRRRGCDLTDPTKRARPVPLALDGASVQALEEILHLRVEHPPSHRSIVCPGTGGPVVGAAHEDLRAHSGNAIRS